MMLVIRIVTKTSQEANWNWQADGQDHILSKADALTKNDILNRYEFITDLLTYLVTDMMDPIDTYPSKN